MQGAIGSLPMEHSPEETQQQTAGDEQQKPAAGVPSKPSRPGILKPPQSSLEPQKQASTKTLRFQGDEHAQPLCAAPLTPSKSTPQKPVSEVDAQSVPPTQDKPKESKEPRSTIDISPPVSPDTEDSLSGSSSSSSSSSLSQGSGDSDSPELSESMEGRGAPSEAVPAAPTAPMFKLPGGRKLKVHPWFPEDFTRFFEVPSRNEGKKFRDAVPRRLPAENGDAEEEDDSSTSTLLEDVPWRPSLPQQTLMALLGGLMLVFLVSAMVRDSRRSGGVSSMKRQLEQDVALSTRNVDGTQEPTPLPQIPLNDIEELPQGRATPDKITALAEGEAGSLAVHNEDSSEATGRPRDSDSKDEKRLQEALGKVRQMRSDALRPLRLSKTKRTCGPPIFTYCQAMQPEFYYNSSTGHCSATSKRHQLCNGGPNSFSSKQSCRLKCVETKRPQKLCFRPVTFVSCPRKDPKDVRRWYFNGKQCVRWRFRPDRCPSQEGKLFATAQECKSSCIAANSSECRVANSTACGSQLQGVYFAHRERKTGLFRCIGMSSIATGSSRSVCLKGANRFTTLQACRKACVLGDNL